VSHYKIKWADFKKIFKEQFVLEVVVSVVRNEWRTLKFNKNQVLKSNQRALELIEILGGSLSSTRGDPLWEEYLRKLPEAAAQDVMQQARLMRHVHKIELTLSDMMDIMAERTLPYLLPTMVSDTPRVASTPTVSTSTADYGDPMDLSNMEDPELYTVDEASKRCFGAWVSDTLRNSVQLQVPAYGLRSFIRDSRTEATLSVMEAAPRLMEATFGVTKAVSTMKDTSSGITNCRGSIRPH